MANMKNVPNKIEIMVMFGILMSHAHTSFSRIAFNLLRKNGFYRFADEEQSLSSFSSHRQTKFTWKLVDDCKCNPIKKSKNEQKSVR